MRTSFKSSWLTIGLILLNMAILGILQSARGPSLPFIQSEYGLSYSNIALLITICSVGMLLGVLIGGRICERFGYRKGLIFATAIIFISLGALRLHTGFERLVINFFFIYTALGWIDIALNSLGSRIFVTKTAILMSLTHFFFGLGSAGGSQYAGFMLAREIPWRHVFISILALYAVSLLLTFFAKLPYAQPGEQRKGLPFLKVVRDVRVWLSFGMIGLCVMFDFGIANWLVIYLRDSRHMNPSASAAYLSLYFILFAIGRLLGGVAAEKLGYIKTFLICILSSAALFFLGIMTGNALLFSGVGLFSSVFFPLFLSIVVKEFKEEAPAVVNVIVPLNSVLFMTSSIVLGMLMERIGVQAGFYIIGSFIVAAPVFLLLLKRKLVYEV